MTRLAKNIIEEQRKLSFVHSRIDENMKDEVSFILNKVGLNVSDAIRLFLKQVILQKGLPFPVMIPNAETRAAIESAERGENLEEITLNELRNQFRLERKNLKKKK